MSNARTERQAIIDHMIGCLTKLRLNVDERDLADVAREAGNDFSCFIVDLANQKADEHEVKVSRILGPLSDNIHDSILETFTDVDFEIEQKADNEECVDMNAEHRLGAYELGLGRYA